MQYRIQKIQFYENGNIMRWIHIDDHSNAILSLMNKGKNYNGYNIIQKTN